MSGRAMPARTIRREPVQGLPVAPFVPRTSGSTGDAPRGRDRAAGGAFQAAFWAMWSRPPRKGPFWLDGASEPP